ncbi:CRISPR-associated endonuclease Cas2 [Thermococcus celer]|uniref:CRISPR-associated endoribonuclease Cas2 n=1 Tax=Thermococcus celer Vu 13 = JCM 8558 TaxID=1293037 RepID=A0A218P100_THECE|nr:CRISPR-associated endonuclease Cas2 [Thermococcus celer]ASI98604.1 CRISPR-associated endonuclease Cas2 [Thermococcus celer Vu 13 = JCM 8558]
MYVIVVYDVDVKRVARVHRFLRTHLHWRQNSVFEGEVTRSQLYEIKQTLAELIDGDDSVLIYELPRENFNLHVIGTDRNPTGEII